MSSRQMTASEFLRERKTEIEGSWLRRVQAFLPAAENRQRAALLDTLSQFLDHLIEALDSDCAVTNANQNNVIATMHGLQRADLGCYTVDQVIEEYRLLQLIVFEALQAYGPIEPHEVIVITDSIQIAIAEAVRAFISRAENQLRGAESEFKLLVQEVKDYGIFMVDPNGIIASWNEGAQRIKGYTGADVIGQNYRMLYIEEDQALLRPERNMANALKDGRHQEQWWRKRKDGSWFWADATMTPVYSQSGNLIGYSKVVRDLTAKKQADDELKAARDAAESANNLKTAFLANMSHEIRTPLGVILGFTESLRDSNLTPEEREKSHEIIQRNGKVLSRLIDDILDLSRVEAGKVEIQLVEINLSGMVAEIVGIAELKAKEKGVQIELHVPETLPTRIVSDPLRLRQILTNVIGNAVKFIERGRVSVALDFEKHLIGDNKMKFTIQDTGPGIPLEKQSKLFRPFSQVDASVTRKYGGSGLGLALSKKLANELGGDLYLVDCPEGKGCTFQVLIADRQGAKVETPKEKPESLERAHSQTGHSLDDFRILLVEDSADNQILLRRLMEKRGAQVSVAGDGAQGVIAALGGDFDIVLMDMQMPVLDGISATRKLRAAGFAKPIIALTAHAMLEQRQASLEAGCDDHLAKPINSAKLLETIGRYVDKVSRAPIKQSRRRDRSPEAEL